MQSTKGFREEFSLDTIYELIKDQAPRLVCELEAKYAFESEKKLSEVLENYENLTKSLLVFSEEGYHKLMLEPYNWANISQLNYMINNTCLVIDW